ncbi:hypothetical protein B7P43_G03541 [Cryptotermes secundus]|uniref:Retinol dehydrogenase 13 n=1 Tax=Cryptotermes secundus TaxID=105785 RepID=A0A2J7R566_9NEOP|nr:hypothetical protein B7P43_G03541 [Cryptotermes secundus]
MVWSPPKKVVYLSAAATCASLACLMKDYTGGRRYEGSHRIDKKVVIITGSNTGIGKETAFELAKRGAHVVMACRDARKCEVARQDIVLRTKNKYVYCRICDLASQESIIQFAERFKSGTGVTVNAVHPGIVDTEIVRHMSFFNSTLSAIFLKPFIWMFIKSPGQGARTTVYMALEESLKDVSGKYFK